MTTGVVRLTLAAGTLSDHATALLASMQTLQVAGSNAVELLCLAGFSGMRGDTADDLRHALAVHGNLVREFNVKIRTSAGTMAFQTHAPDAANVVDVAVKCTGDSPCGITVTPADPDRQALAAAHRTLGITKPLDIALDHPSLGRALRTYARKHPVRADAYTDFKSLAANDRD